MTKEEKRKYDKKYREANKEKYAANKKAWNRANKEKIAAEKKVYYQANKEKLAAYDKAYKESKKDGLYTVYHLVNENYVGQTSNLYTRLNNHRNNQNRDVSNVQILGKYKTRKEAMEVEARYHSKGYLGCNNGL